MIQRWSLTNNAPIVTHGSELPYLVKHRKGFRVERFFPARYRTYFKEGRICESRHRNTLNTLFHPRELSYFGNIRSRPKLPSVLNKVKKTE